MAFALKFLVTFNFFMGHIRMLLAVIVRVTAVAYAAHFVKPPAAERQGLSEHAAKRGKLPIIDLLSQTALKESTFYRRLREFRLSKRARPAGKKRTLRQPVIAAGHEHVTLEIVA